MSYESYKNRIKKKEEELNQLVLAFCIGVIRRR